MIVRAEVFIEINKTSDFPSADSPSTQFECMRRLAWRLENAHDIVKIRMPDSPEPDISGYIEFDRT